jgi:hypothetical protein
MSERLYAFLEAVANTDSGEHARNLMARLAKEHEIGCPHYDMCWLSFNAEETGMEKR